MFKFTPNIEYLALQSKQITNIGLNLLDNLKSLRIVYFDLNICTSFIDVIDWEDIIKELKQELDEKCTPTQEMIDHVKNSADESSSPDVNFPSDSADEECRLNNNGISASLNAANGSGDKATKSEKSADA